MLNSHLFKKKVLFSFFFVQNPMFVGKLDGRLHVLRGGGPHGEGWRVALERVVPCCVQAGRWRVVVHKT